MNEKTMYEAIIAQRMAGLVGQQQQDEQCEFHGDDFAACQMYSGQIPCEPEPEAEPPAAADERGKWDYCPECGSEAVGHEEGDHKQCADCRQEWWADIDYSDVVRKHLGNNYSNWQTVIESKDALLARAKTAEADFLAAAECNVEQRKTIQRFQTELATERLRADAAVVMPERMTTIPEGKTISYAAGYEDALDAVAHLNHCTLSLELLKRATQYIESQTYFKFGEPVTPIDAVGRNISVELRVILEGGKPLVRLHQKNAQN